MLLLLKTTQLWLNIYENYFLMPEIQSRFLWIQMNVSNCLE